MDEQSLYDVGVLLHGIIKQAPRLAEPHVLLARCLERIGSRQGAIEHLEQALMLTPSDNSVAEALTRLRNAS